MIRLDKRLSVSGEYTRQQAQRLIRGGRVTADGKVLTDPSQKIAETAVVTLDGQPLEGVGLRYVLLNKPSGLLTAARDSRQPTVMSLLPPAFGLRGVMPVGRLDKDTTGVLLLTDDGELCHRLLSPKRHVDKVYYATVDGPLTKADVDAFSQGLSLSDFTAQPAKLDILTSSEAESTALVTVGEGKFHQIKRMFSAVGREVTALDRRSFGGLTVQGLSLGEYRLLGEDEIRALYQLAQMNFEKE